MWMVLLTKKIPFVKHSSHWGESPQDRLGDMWSCGMILTLAHVLHHLSTA